VLHALPRPGLRRRVLPALLLSASGAAFAGLVALAPAPQEPPAMLAYADVPVLAPAEVERAVEERAIARASRSRRIEERKAAEAKARAEAAAKAKAAAEAAAKAKAAAEAKAKAEAAAKAKAQRARSAFASRAAVRGSTACPVPNATFTDTWGAPRSGGRSHRGTDLMAPYGSRVYAVAAGTVRTAYSSAGGVSLYLRADNGETYFYAHNASNTVRDGQRVRAGDLVARVGTSGNAPDGAPHVHFERQVGGSSVNPYAFLRRICG
jgi:murein DD-endopeptidase MepM/ murein hydrolase activator NlpD